MLEDKLARMRGRAEAGKVKVMIVGLGSVGCYLLDYLMSTADPGIEVVVAGRDRAKMERDVNIVRVASLIRGQNRTDVAVDDGLDLEDVGSIASLLERHDPDVVVNSSRVFAGLKYGSISWGAVRAYGIWAPLSVRYIRNIMLAYGEAGCGAVVVNTSYSDATLPWLKGAGVACPDFGSGNLNHLLPRIKLAAAAQAGIEDFWNVEVHMATAHFHDVVISKEGHNEGVEQLLRVEYGGEALDVDQDALLRASVIPMPVDQKRNMMNASSNFDIVEALLAAARAGERRRVFSPGAFGNVGGYPVVLDGAGDPPRAFIDESRFKMADMEAKNRESLALDGVEDVGGGTLVYTDALLDKAERAFGVRLPKEVPLGDADEVAGLIVDEIILPELARRGEGR